MIDSSGTAPDISRPISSFVLKSGVLFLFGFALLNAGMFWRVRESMLQGYGDFASFYTAGEIVRSGQSPRLYEPALQWKVQQQFASTVKIRLGPLPYIRPPFEALLFLPLAYLPYPVACVIWMALKFVLLLTGLFLLPSMRGEGKTPATYGLSLLLCLAFFPVAFDLIQGQDSVLLLLILVVGLRLLLRGNDLGCGAVLALGLFKFHFAIPLIAIFVLRKKGKVVLGFLAVAVLLFGISLVMVGWSGALVYPRYLLGLNQVPGLGMVKPQSMPNVRGLMSLWLGNGPLPASAQWFLGGVVILGTVIASRSWRGDDRRSILMSFSFAIIMTLATSYYANAYDLTLLLLPLFLIGGTFLRGSNWEGLKDRVWPRLLFLGAAAVLLCAPVSWVLALHVDQFCWMALTLFALAVSLSAAEGHPQRASL